MNNSRTIIITYSLNLCVFRTFLDFENSGSIIIKTTIKIRTISQKPTNILYNFFVIFELKNSAASSILTFFLKCEKMDI